ncbi:hypothetical protein GGQ91_004241 [Methylobacterium fujisawaense]|uniref:Uncharacterized protein n=1 Tax=Methylobacterium fujisawaense TaxID=107400 RepID=A0ABR6DFF7_9HYPH|nr:hypothetical protein [Methylobacterium fujisawaense]
MTGGGADCPVLPLCPPPCPPPSEFGPAESTLLTRWRTFWRDLPLARAGAVDRLLYRWVRPADIAAHSVGSTEGRDGRDGGVGMGGVRA